MGNLIIQHTEHTPEIKFDSNRNVLEIRGKSYAEDVTAFYRPVLSWLDKYIMQLGNQKVNVNVELIYFNSGSVKPLMKIFDMLDAAAGRGKHVVVNWIYNKGDEDSIEFGQDFQEDLKSVKFNMVQKY